MRAKAGGRSLIFLSASEGPTNEPDTEVPSEELVRPFDSSESDNDGNTDKDAEWEDGYELELEFDEDEGNRELEFEVEEGEGERVEVIEENRGEVALPTKHQTSGNSIPNPKREANPNVRNLPAATRAPTPV